MKSNLWCVVAIVGLLAGCSKGGSLLSNPAGPSDTPVAGSPTVVSGRDGSPVAAQITGSGSSLSVSAPGYLQLDTTDRHRQLYLWPNDAQVTLADTFSFVYNGSDFNPLARIGDSTSVVSVVPSAGILADERATAALHQGLDILNSSLSASGVALRYVVGGSGQVRVDISVDPSDPVFAGASQPGAATYNSRDGNGVIKASRIVILNIDYARMPIVTFHELLHTYGLGHSLHPGPMMIGPGVYGFSDFTDTDRVYMRLFRTRQPGTRISVATATENDRGAASASSAGVHTDVIVCN